ncbi:hypothetical protein PGA11657_05720 [Lactobacillus paragasseri]|nr:hypothetical protein PGA11657_05720 [Lactobacillus paragasseri]
MFYSRFTTPFNKEYFTGNFKKRQTFVKGLRFFNILEKNVFHRELYVIIKPKLRSRLGYAFFTTLI